jgi:hypothetical protein
MENEHVHLLESWLKKQIEKVEQQVQDAKLTKNYGKLAMFEGMLIAFHEMLNKIHVGV